MGPYCQFCDRRCFVPNPQHDDRATILATCRRGKEHDHRLLGYCWTDVNPDRRVLQKQPPPVHLDLTVASDGFLAKLQEVARLTEPCPKCGFTRQQHRRRHNADPKRRAVCP